MKFNVDKENWFKIGVYKIENLITGSLYIGSTREKFRARWCKHRSSYKNQGQRKTHPILFKAYDKYGIDNFEMSILEIIEAQDKEEIFKREQYYIDTLNPKYNICKDVVRGGCPNQGRKLSEEWKSRIGKKSSLYKHSKEVKEAKSKQNKEGSSIYRVYSDSFEFTGSLIDCSKALNVILPVFLIG
mgnify:CR=1 FL=1